MFDSIPALAAPRPSEFRNELDRFLSTDVEDVRDPLQWWYDGCQSLPKLSRNARDYLSIPGV
jgi:hypothetical protein